MKNLINILKAQNLNLFHRRDAETQRTPKSSGLFEHCFDLRFCVFTVKKVLLETPNVFSRLVTLRLCVSAVILVCLASQAFAGIYPCNGGNNRRENRNLAPSSITNPLNLKWESTACVNVTTPAGGPVVLADRVIQAFVHGIRCVDRATGTPLWTWPCPDVELYYTPTYDPDRNVIYVSRMDGSTLCLSVINGNVLWYFYENDAAGVGQFSSPIYVNHKLYVGNGGAGFCCLDPDTHAVLWRFNFTTYLGYFYRDGVCTPAYDNGSIYFSTRNGHMFCLRESDGYCQWHIQEKCWRQNALLLSDDYVYSMANQGSLSCRRRTNGTLVWSTGLTGTTDGNLAICGTLLIVPGDSWRIWGIDMFTGDQVWCTKLTGNFARNTPFVVCGKIYISACHGDFYGLDGQTGKVEWRYHHGVEYTFIDWAEADGNLFASLKDGRILCFEPVTPGNPAACVCNLNSTPVPTNTPTFTPVFTNTPAATTTPGCAGGICLVSDTTNNQVFFDANNSVPANDASSRDWKNPDYTTGVSWVSARAVTQPPGEWIAPCSSTGANRTWIAPFDSGLPPTLADTYFRNSFTLPGGVSITSVNMSLSADNSVEVWLNGNYLGLFTGPIIGDSHLYGRCAPVTVNPSFFRAGTNVLAFRLINTMTYLGMTYECCLGFTCSGAPLTPTWTTTNTPTSTYTPTNTPTITPTPTGTWQTSTPTPSPTNSPTPTITVTPSNTPEKVCDPVLFPNPTNGEPVKFHCGGGPYENIEVNVYTTALRKVCHKKHVCNGLEEEDVTLDLKDDHGDELANGLYFVDVETHKKGLVKKYVKKCLKLR